MVVIINSRSKVKAVTCKTDRDACLVWLPELEEFGEKLHDMITDHQRHLKLSDIAGLPIRHGPRVLAGFFRTVLHKNGSVYAVATGELRTSPWPAPGDKGGGAVIHCSYYITSTPSKFEYNIFLLSSTLEKMVEGSVMNVSCMYLLVDISVLSTPCDIDQSNHYIMCILLVILYGPKLPKMNRK